MKRRLLVLAVMLLAAAVTRGEFTLVERWPAGGSACLDTPLRLTFDKPPRLGNGGKIEVCRSSDGAPVATIEPGTGPSLNHLVAVGNFMLRQEPVWIEGNTAHVRLRARSLSTDESYFVRISPGVFIDDDGHAFAGVADGWTFRTKAALPRNPDRITVAADGSSDFCTVQGAVDQIEPHRQRPAVIFVRKGRYRELVRIGRERRFIHLVGEDRKGTVIACVNNDKLNSGWIQRCVLGVEADDFHLENLTVRNETPKGGSQAEAVVINAERCVLRNADFISLQDTLNLSGRVFVSGCYIEGDVDFVWGYGTACFENCHLHAMNNGWFLQARNPVERSGYVFLDCQLTAAAGVNKLWLARIETTRFPASQVSFIRSRMGPGIDPSGWQITGAETGKLRFEEFATRNLEGQPTDVSRRHSASKQLTAEEAENLSDPAKLLRGGDGWQPPRARIVLVGDSTVASSSGWGDAFAGLLKPGVECVNFGRGGRSSKSYRAEGYWEQALALRPDWVLIQFGHNDQPGKGPERESDPATTFRENLTRYVEEVRAMGAKPVLITSLTRRNFDESGALIRDLTAYVEATRAVAETNRVPLIDLNARSMEQIEKLGPNGIAQFEVATKDGRTDHTHLSPCGAELTAPLVALEIREAAPELFRYLQQR